jgi:hypothetical protein
MEFPDLDTDMTDEEILTYAREVRLSLTDKEQKILHAFAVIRHESDDVCAAWVMLEGLSDMFREGRLPGPSVELEAPGASEFEAASRPIPL